ncbi:transposase [Candidatus Woesebacteria bacterium]|nr:MAG: transposase [Candidatus Woesebacteria bacterium]
MLRKNKKKSRSSKKCGPPSKIRLRKYLNADALFMVIQREFEKIPEFRTGDIEISIPDALMSAFAMFSLKDPSLLKFDERRKDEAECQNLESVYGIKNIPSDSRMREICDEIDPKKYLSPIFKVLFRHLQRGKELEPMVFYKGCYLLNLDGTGFFSSKKVSAPYCMEKVNKKTGESTYYLQMLGAAIVHPDFKEVIPLCPEMIIKQDGTTKNDCERNAAKRFFEQLRKDHPHLPFIINEDALSPNAPHIKDMKRYNLHYILGVKPGDHKFLFGFVKDTVQDGRAIEFAIEDKDDPDITHRFCILNEVPLNKSNQEVLVNFIEYWEYSKKTNKVGYHNTWITDFTLTKENAYIIMRGGRARWKIENETFNTLKNQGYNLGHNYGLGKKHLAAVFTMLMMLAFLVDQTQQLCCALFRSVWKKLGSKISLWESIRSCFKCFLIESMEMLYRALLYGFKAQPLKQLIDTYDTS